MMSSPFALLFFADAPLRPSTCSRPQNLSPLANISAHFVTHSQNVVTGFSHSSRWNWHLSHLLSNSEKGGRKVSRVATLGLLAVIAKKLRCSPADWAWAACWFLCNAGLYLQIGGRAGIEPVWLGLVRRAPCALSHTQTDPQPTILLHSPGRTPLLAIPLRRTSLRHAAARRGAPVQQLPLLGAREAARVQPSIGNSLLRR